jgi:hypothetical protein
MLLLRTRGALHDVHHQVIIALLCRGGAVILTLMVAACSRNPGTVAGRAVLRDGVILLPKFYSYIRFKTLKIGGLTPHQLNKVSDAALPVCLVSPALLPVVGD